MPATLESAVQIPTAGAHVAPPESAPDGAQTIARAAARRRSHAAGDPLAKHGPDARAAFERAYERAVKAWQQASPVERASMRNPIKAKGDLARGWAMCLSTQARHQEPPAAVSAPEPAPDPVPARVPRARSVADCSHGNDPQFCMDQPCRRRRQQREFARRKRAETLST